MLRNSKELKVYLQGGLGNQLFELAAGKYLAEKLNKKLVPVSEFRNITGFFRKESILGSADENTPVAQSRYKIALFRILRRIASINRLSSWLILKATGIYFSNVVGYDSKLESICPKAINGYFQTCRFSDYMPQIESLLNFSSESDEAVFQTILSELSQKNPIGIHIRRGDYLNENQNIGLLSDSYFETAIRALGSMDREYWVVTDSPELLEEFVSKFHFPVKIVSDLNRLPALASIVALSKFQELIISNSTFSLAAALMGTQEKKVHYPEPWFRNLSDPVLDIPSEWIAHRSTWTI